MVGPMVEIVSGCCEQHVKAMHRNGAVPHVPLLLFCAHLFPNALPPMIGREHGLNGSLCAGETVKP